MRISDWSSDVCSSDLDRGIGASSQLELLAIRRDNRLHGVDTSTEEGLNEINATDTTASETILRGVLRRSGKLLSIDLGAEGAINVLDSHVALTENGIEVPTPADDGRAAENRAEFFLTGTRSEERRGGEKGGGHR